MMMCRPPPHRGKQSHEGRSFFYFFFLGQVIVRKHMLPLSREQRLYNFLNDKKWYSFTLQYTKDKLGLKSTDDVCKLANRLSTLLGSMSPANRVNIFKYNDRTYVGLESRRLDYEKDKRLGINPVENLIHQGIYK